MDDTALTHLLQALNRQEMHHPGPACLPLSRLRTAHLRENWTGEEQRHLAGCPHCRRSESLVRDRAWHPTLVHLFWHIRGLLEGQDNDVRHHLQKDGCRRCQSLSAVLAADRVLTRLATQVRQAGQNASNRLGRTLASASVATISPTTDSNTRFEDGQHAVHLSQADPLRLRLEFPAGAQPPRLFRLLIGNSQRGRDHFLIPSPSSSNSRTAEVRLSDPVVERVVLALYPVDPTLLTREDAPGLQSAFAAACKSGAQAVQAWKNWSAQALTQADLDGGLRPLLDAMTRGEAGKVV